MKTALPAALVGLLLLVGCTPSASTSPPVAQGGVAVIDLDAVAARLGADQQIAGSITTRQAALGAQLRELAKNYNEQLDAKRQAPAAAEDAGVQLASFEQTAAANLTEAKRRAEQNLAAHKVQLVRQFRDQIRPAARQIARERGLSVIVTKNDGLLFDFVETVDITDDVVAALLRPATAAPATAPATKTAMSQAPAAK